MSGLIGGGVGAVLGLGLGPRVGLTVFGLFSFGMQILFCLLTWTAAIQVRRIMSGGLMPIGLGALALLVYLGGLVYAVSSRVVKRRLPLGPLKWTFTVAAVLVTLLQLSISRSWNPISLVFTFLLVTAPPALQAAIFAEAERDARLAAEMPVEEEAAVVGADGDAEPKPGGIDGPQ